MINECGVVQDCEIILFESGRSRAEIRIGLHDGKWYWSTSHQLPCSGSGYAPSPKWRNPSFEECTGAEEEAKKELTGKLERVVNGKHETQSDKNAAEELLALIRESNQLSLF